MTQGEDQEPGSPHAGGERPQLRTLPGGGAGGPPAEVRLRREFKGLTVREVLTDARLVEQLPGRVQSALEHLRRGEFAAADRAIPGHFGEVLQGPGHRPRPTARLWPLWILAVGIAIASASFLLAR